MKRPLLLCLALIALGGCVSTPTIYQPAATPGAMGYAETPIEHDRWRVSFHGGSGANLQQVYDLALQRAAELTLDKGYDWFRVSDRHAEGQGGGVRPDVSLGFGGADFGGHSAFGTGVGLGFDFNTGQAVTVTLEILMGHGPAPREPDAYDAHDLRRSFGRPV
jgi:hypothetical protein